MVARNYYMVTKNGLLDVRSMLVDETREAVRQNLKAVTDESYGRLQHQELSIVAVDESELSDLAPESIAGFGRFFERNDLKRCILLEWIEDNEPYHYFLGDGRITFFEDALGLIPRESVADVRDDLSKICAGERTERGRGRTLYIPLITLAEREDLLDAAKKVFNTVMGDNGYEMVAVLEWTGTTLTHNLTVV